MADRQELNSPANAHLMVGNLSELEMSRKRRKELDGSPGLGGLALPMAQLSDTAPSSPMISPAKFYKDFAVSQLSPGGRGKYTSPLFGRPDRSCVRFVSDSEFTVLDVTINDELGNSGDPAALASVSGASVDIGARPRVERAGARRKIHFDPKNVTAGIVTCGGLCPGLNNVIRAIVNILWYRYDVRNIIGFKYGYEGLTPDGINVKLTPEGVKDIHQSGGTILGTSRGPQDPKAMVDHLQALGVNMLFPIGGDGTQKGGHAISTEALRRGLDISVVGVGKTIDNDLLFVDKSFGFETAVSLSQLALISAHEEARSARNGIGIVKLMGRESGAIALHAALANGDVNMLLVPEIHFTIDDIMNYLLERFKTRDHVLIVCAEGAGQQLMANVSATDKSGNKVLSDIGVFLKDEIGKRFKALNVPVTIKYIDPSYQIRSGITSASDSILCTQYGQMAVHAAMAGKTDMMVGLVHNDFVHLPLAKVTQGRKSVDINSLTFQALLDSTGTPFYQAAKNN